MFRREAEKLQEVYVGVVKTTQEELDDFLLHSMPYLRALVESFDKNQAAAMAVEELKHKLHQCEECSDE